MVFIRLQFLDFGKTFFPNQDRQIDTYLCWGAIAMHPMQSREGQSGMQEVQIVQVNAHFLKDPQSLTCSIGKASVSL